jgi:hypothetical protein
MTNFPKEPEYVLDYSKWPQRTMTQEEWNKTSNDCKGIRPDGTKTLLIWETGVGSTLAVVTKTPAACRWGEEERI